MKRGFLKSKKRIFAASEKAPTPPTTIDKGKSKAQTDAPKKNGEIKQVPISVLSISEGNESHPYLVGNFSTTYFAMPVLLEKGHIPTFSHDFKQLPVIPRVCKLKYGPISQGGGMYATRDIPKGGTIFIEAPVLMARLKLKDPECLAMFPELFARLDSQSRNDIYRLNDRMDVTPNSGDDSELESVAEEHDEDVEEDKSTYDEDVDEKPAMDVDVNVDTADKTRTTEEDIDKVAVADVVDAAKNPDDDDDYDSAWPYGRHDVSAKQALFANKEATIFTTHSIGIYPLLTDDPADKENDNLYHGLYVDISRINHSCKSNALHRFDPETFSLVVRAARPIARGEQITISYASDMLPRSVRRPILRRAFGIQCCQCAGCKPFPPTATAQDKADLVAISDEARVYVGSHWHVDLPLIYSMSYAEKMATVEKHIYTLELIEQEGLYHDELEHMEGIAFVYASLVMRDQYKAVAQTEGHVCGDPEDWDPPEALQNEWAAKFFEWAKKATESAIARGSRDAYERWAQYCNYRLRT